VVAFRVKGQERLNAKIRDMVRRAEDARPAMKAIGIMQVRSIQKNFETGGRPRRWAASMRAAMAGKPGGKGGKTLIQSAQLKNSITFSAGSKNVKIGTNKKYAPAHQFGMTLNIPEIRPKRAKALRFVGAGGEIIFTRRVKAHKVKIPKREFLLFQKEDIKRAERVLIDHVVGIK